jgi:hypothetical protein
MNNYIYLCNRNSNKLKPTKEEFRPKVSTFFPDSTALSEKVLYFPTISLFYPAYPALYLYLKETPCSYPAPYPALNTLYPALTVVQIIHNTSADREYQVFQALEPGVSAIGTKCFSRWNQQFQLSEQKLKLLLITVNTATCGGRDRTTSSAG